MGAMSSLCSASASSGPSLGSAGLLVRPAAATLAFAMVVAFFSVHIDHGLLMSNSGYEFGLALLAASVALAISGASEGSLDRVLARRA